MPLDFIFASQVRKTAFQVKRTALNAWNGSTFPDVIKSEIGVKSLSENKNLINPHCPKCLEISETRRVYGCSHTNMSL